MVDLELGDLVDRLRDVAGGVTTVKQQAVQRVGEGTLLVLQQCLRRHPVVSLLLTSSTERDRECLTLLREAHEVEPPAPGNDILDTLAWINAAASELEVERLSGAFEDGEKAHAWCREQLLKHLGLTDAPLFTQNRESSACPWNVLFSVLAGPLRHVPTAALVRSDLDIPNATSAMLSALHEIRVEWTNSVAWCNLLKELGAFPVGNVRAIWQCALYIFPTSGTLVHQYLKREIEDLVDKRSLRQCHEEDEARALFRAHLRILNTFHRHLEICYSCRLYELFFDYLRDFIEPDNPTHTDKLFVACTDKLYIACLFRDVGFLPCSTPLWTRYLTWKSAALRDEGRRIEWRRSIFRHILQMPLLGTDKIKEEYDAFVSYELGGRMAPPEKIEVEKMYTRAKMEAEEINQLLLVLTPEERLMPAAVAGAPPVPAYKTSTSTASAHGGYGFFGVPPVLTPQLVAAYEPPASYEDGLFVTWHGDTRRQDDAEEEGDSKERLDHVRRMVAASTRLWGLWETLVRMVRMSSLGSASLRRDRVRVYLTMRACFFVRHESNWRELMDYVADGKLTTYDEKERLTLAENVLHLHGILGVRGIFFPIYAADVFYHQLERRGAAFRLLQRAAQDELQWLLNFIRNGNQAEATPAVVDHLRAQEARHDNAASSTHLQNLCVLGVNWMRMISRQHDRFHSLLVSRYMMHQIDFLSLTMSVLKLLLKSGAIRTPQVHLRPFNVFCAEWIRLEIVRNQNYDAAAQVLWQWKEHLRMLLRSAKGKQWTPEMCGTDESFVDACASLMIADAAKIPDVLRCIGELAEIARADALGGDFLSQCESLRHRFFHASAAVQDLPPSILSNTAGPPASRVPTTRYDTQLFTPTEAEPLPTGWDDMTDEAQRAPHPLAFAASGTALAVDTFPEESLWAQSHHFGGSRHAPTPRFESFHIKASDASTPRVATKRTLVCTAFAASPATVPLLSTREPRSGRGHGPGPDASRSRPTPTGAIGNLLMHLPTRYQYLPVDGDISTEWLLRFLSSTDGLTWTEGMVRPATPSPSEDEEADEANEEEEGDYDDGDELADEEGEEEGEFDEELYAALEEEMGGWEAEDTDAQPHDEPHVDKEE